MRRYNIRFFCYTHIGKCRKFNQDNFICNGVYMEQNHDTLEHPVEGTVSVSKSPLFGVFDGMGGEHCGEVAAYIAAELASHMSTKNNLIVMMKEFCRKANKKICDYAEKNEIGNMGTTAAMILFHNKEVILCNIGDSKVFQFSDVHFTQISEDHVAFHVSGEKAPLSQNLGIPEEEMRIEPYIVSGKLQDGDIFLLCSDGLTDMVSEKKMEEIIKNTKFENIAERLLTEALENGGRDNITLIVCRVEKEINFLEKVFRKENF